jgi:phenylpyruvate tautomerase PptA (4-oxalocrotonate tautomerase family)
VEELRAWLQGYRAEHAEDDPDATHVQVLETTRLSWLTGGRLLDREEFL